MCDAFVEVGAEAGRTKNAREGAEAWKRAHAELVRLAATRARLDAEEGSWLVRALRVGTHLRLGYASFAEYVERLFGYSPRWTAEKLRVADALEKLPETSSSLRDGSVWWSVTRELTRVATRATESEWLAAARGRTARDVERLVSGHRTGSRPSDAPDPSARRHVLRFEVSGETLAIFREAMAKLRRDADESMDDDAALLLMSRCVLGGPTEVGRVSYQVAMTVCEGCKRGRMQGRGELVTVDGEVVEMAACDAQIVATQPGADTHVGDAPERAKQSIPPAVRGKLRIEGRASSELVFRHADGSAYGSSSVSPATVEARAKAYRALRALGFREKEARNALERADTHVGVGTSVEAIVRRALAELTRRTAA
jgi:hypothetical protein